MRTSLHIRLMPALLGLVAVLTAVPVLAQVTVQVGPSGQSVPVTGTKQFTATVSGTANTAVTWTVNGTPNGDLTTVGSISNTGLYTAPALAPAGYSVTIGATSLAAPGVSGSVALQVRERIPWVTTLAPATVIPGPVTLTVNGSRFVSGATVLWNGTPIPTSFISSTQLGATWTAPSPGVVYITVANPGPAAVSTPLSLTVTPNITVTVGPSNVSLPLGGTQTFSATLGNTTNQSVTWLVNGKVGGGSGGTITTAGAYTAPLIMPTTGAVTVSARSDADGVTTGAVTVKLTDPQAVTYSRFLSQATFGPTPALMAHVKQVGMSGFLDEQFGTAASPIPNTAGVSRSTVIDAFFTNLVNGNDQVRQRVIHALSEIVVITLSKNTNGDEVAPWLQILSDNAFGKYRDLIRAITLDASMGHFLDLVNSSAGNGSSAANENYPRELMQLFTIGLYKLNPDGSIQKDANNQPMPAYTQFDVAQVAKALTGWTYTNAQGNYGWGQNHAYYPGQMIPAATGRHDTSQKIVLGTVIPANQTIQQDLDSVLDILFTHPNAAPFMATRLIRALVTSNPSPAYIARISAVFTATDGDLAATVRAILMDQDARQDVVPANFGRLRTASEYTAAFARALGIQINGAAGSAYLFYNMNEGILDAPSVFGHYSPSYKIPKGNGLFGPEFQIFSASDAVNRANWFYGFLFNPWPINPLFTPFVQIASDTNALVGAVDNALFFGRMSPALRNTIVTACGAASDNNQKVITALYLAGTSGEFIVQR